MNSHFTSIVHNENDSWFFVCSCGESTGPHEDLYDAEDAAVEHMEFLDD